MIYSISYNIKLLIKNSNYITSFSIMLLLSSLLAFFSLTRISPAEVYTVDKIYWFNNPHMIDFITIFIYTIPLVSTLGLTLSYYKECDFENNLILRCGSRANYILSRLIVLIISNFIFWMLFFVINYIICYVFVGEIHSAYYTEPFIIGNDILSMSKRFLFASVAVNNSLLNIIIYMLMMTTYSSCISLIIFSLSLHIMNRFITAFVPFLLTLLFSFVTGLFQGVLTTIYPQNIFHPQPSIFSGTNGFLIIMIILYLFTFICISALLIIKYIRRES